MKTLLKLLFFILSISTNAQGIDKSLYAFDFKMEHLPIAERAKLFAKLGYSGTTLRVQSDKQRDILSLPYPFCFSVSISKIILKLKT